MLPGLDARFLDSVEACVSSISEHPERSPVVEGTIRRLLMRGFPYSVFYAAYPNEAVVIACLHGARSPQVWRRRGAGSTLIRPPVLNRHTSLVRRV